MVYLFCALLGGGILAAICVPLFRKESTLESAIIEETEWDLLVRKKEVILANIQDLDFEYKCGKLSEADYSQIRGEMTAEAAHVLEHIHNLEGNLDLDALIRREVSARKNPQPKKKNALHKGKVDREVGSNPQYVQEELAKCPSCNAGNSPSNKFCAECGAKLG